MSLIYATNCKVLSSFVKGPGERVVEGWPLCYPWAVGPLQALFDGLDGPAPPVG